MFPYPKFRIILAFLFCIILVKTTFANNNQQNEWEIHSENIQIGIVIGGIENPATGTEISSIPISGASKPDDDISILKVSSGMPFAGRESPNTI